MLFLSPEAIAVDADDHRFTRVDLRRPSCGGFLDAVLRQAFGDGLGHAAVLFDFLDQLPRALFQLAGQLFDIPASA
jgi:hypothetical protein